MTAGIFNKELHVKYLLATVFRMPALEWNTYAYILCGCRCEYVIYQNNSPADIFLD